MKVWQINRLVRAAGTPNFIPIRANLPGLGPLNALYFRVATPVRFLQNNYFFLSDGNLVNLFINEECSQLFHISFSLGVV